MLFINIKLLIIVNYISKGFPGQLHDALCKCIEIIFACRVYAKVAQLVEYISSKNRLFYLCESGGSSPTMCLFFSIVFCSLFCLILFHYCFIFIIFF